MKLLTAVVPAVLIVGLIGCSSNYSSLYEAHHACRNEEEKLEAEHEGKGRSYHCLTEEETNQVLLLRIFKEEGKSNEVAEHYRY